jgi:hypothetical protein
MFESTLPVGVPDLMRVSAFRRYLDESGRGMDSGNSCLSSLSPSLMLDLQRFEQGGRHTELLEVIAACVRHGKSLSIHLECDNRVVPLTIFPVQRMAHCPVPVAQFLQMRLNDLIVLHVEAAVLRPPSDGAGPPSMEEVALFAPLGALTWELALRGSRGDLLPEISSKAAYRIPPGVDLRGLELNGTLAAAVHRMKRQTTNLKELASWPGFDRERAMRLLNALYLQAGLMVTRTHPAATNDSWST